MPEPNLEDAKRLAAAKALELVTSGMRLGLGTGTTAAQFVALLGARVAEGLDVICVPTSERTRTQAALYSIPLATIDALPELDLTIDGTDEFDPKLNLIKGGGAPCCVKKSSPWRRSAWSSSPIRQNPSRCSANTRCRSRSMCSASK